MATRASYVHDPIVEFSRASQKFWFYTVFSENVCFRQNKSQGFSNSVQLYKQYPLEKFFIFTIYQNYTLALKPKRHSVRCHDFVVHALLLRMHTNVVDFRVMRRLCHREWNWLWNWRCVNQHSWDPWQRTTWSRCVTSDFNSVLCKAHYKLIVINPSRTIWFCHNMHFPIDPSRSILGTSLQRVKGIVQ